MLRPRFTLRTMIVLVALAGATLGGFMEYRRLARKAAEYRAQAGEHAGMAQFTAPGGRFTAGATTLKFLVEWAYGIQPFQHSSGPSWFETDRYDIVAKAEGSATDGAAGARAE